MESQEMLDKIGTVDDLLNRATDALLGFVKQAELIK